MEVETDGSPRSMSRAIAAAAAAAAAASAAAAVAASTSTTERRRRPHLRRDKLSVTAPPLLRGVLAAVLVAATLGCAAAVAVVKAKPSRAAREWRRAIDRANALNYRELIAANKKETGRASLFSST